MGNCISHIRCPACAKHGRDNGANNLGVYDDGSSYCFSCGYSSGASNLEFSSEGRTGRFYESDRRPTSSDKHPSNSIGISLPTDSKSLIDDDCPDAWSFLYKYDLTIQEISDNLLLFSKNGIYLQKEQVQVTDLLIFPIYSAGELIMWNGRNLKYNGSNKKWVIKGKKEGIIHEILPTMYKVGVERYSSCCVCEDVISAIKLGRIIPTYPLFGTSISESLLKYLSLNYYELLIYLDFDAIDTMMKLQKKVAPYFSKVRIIISRLDPKYYGTEELREIIK